MGTFLRNCPGIGQLLSEQLFPLALLVCFAFYFPSLLVVGWCFFFSLHFLNAFSVTELFLSQPMTEFLTFTPPNLSVILLQQSERAVVWCLVVGRS